MNQRVEPIVMLLAGLVVFFTLLLVGVAKFMAMDGQTFQVVSGLVTGFAGALLMRVKPRAAADPSGDPLPEGTTRKTEVQSAVHTETVVPPAAPSGQ